jgi:hypothetical protein
MVAHKFKLGELVEVVQTWTIQPSRGPYEIVGLLPEADGDPQYRVKSRHDEHERVAKESLLSRFYS